MMGVKHHGKDDKVNVDVYNIGYAENGPSLEIGLDLIYRYQFVVSSLVSFCTSESLIFFRMG